MIAYLPEIYPDELAYSWFCRYYVHSGCITHKMALNDILYKRCNNPSKEFLGHLQSDMLLKIEKMYPLRHIVQEHTMFPQYARFIPREQKKKAMHFLAHDFCDAHFLFAILPRNESDRYLKYCPLCVKEDRENYGETYWHRIHQIRNMQVCHKHGCYLHSSTVTAKSDQTFTLCPAELFAVNDDITMVGNPQEIQYAKYMPDVFNAPMEFDKDIPISAVMYYAINDTPYIKKSGRTKYTKQLTEDIRAFYQTLNITDAASMNQIQRLFLGERFDFSVVCQIWFFLHLPVKQLVNPSLTAAQIQQENDTHYMRNREPIDWAAFDVETAALLERIARDIYNGTASDTGRPERVSEKLIYRTLDLPKHRLENLPKCRAILERYSETYPENWARRIVWAYKELKRNGGEKPHFWSDIRQLSGVKRKNIDAVLPLLCKYTDDMTANAIRKIVE